MDGFREDLPIQAKVTWAGAEVPLLECHATTYGLLAQIPTPGIPNGITRYFVPWTAVSYLKQDIPPPPPSTDPIPVLKVVR